MIKLNKFKEQIIVPIGMFKLSGNKFPDSFKIKVLKTLKFRNLGNF